jgi:hypothetical protein
MSNPIGSKIESQHRPWRVNHRPEERAAVGRRGHQGGPPASSDCNAWKVGVNRIGRFGTQAMSANPADRKSKPALARIVPRRP